ncbi:hypothetical protein TNIN_41661 [Trichonephila inaurata madagascariensis]|uniref:Cyclin B n=1 Tax=Trichonephila inaurata madagascariensis TaxID=2747483 RepID=A0A8X6M5Y6_9ARAC|nr:hypothetical protein TNIN_41661 [Trichonephila inaurata madagascariensis]
METIRNVENQNPFAVKRPVRNTAVRKPLRGLENRVKNIPVKTSFKEKPQILTAKENVKDLKLAKTKVKAKEALADVVELQESLPVIDSLISIEIPKNVENIDAEDGENPQLVSPYINEIYAYLRNLEIIFPIKLHHLDCQPEVTGKMRGVLVDWLVQVHLRFHLLQETLYMTISILDRFLQSDKVKRSQLQCAGVTAMFIASKYEEMYAPDISDFVYITDSTYSKVDILKMEKIILRSLDFNLSKPLPLHFLRRNSKAGNVDATIHALAKYFLELTLPEYDMAHHLPSALAAASLYLSLRLLSATPWSETLTFYSGYSEDRILPVVKKLCKIVRDSETIKLQAIRVKYSSSKLFKVSTLPQLKSSLITEFANSVKN